MKFSMASSLPFRLFEHHLILLQVRNSTITFSLFRILKIPLRHTCMSQPKSKIQCTIAQMFAASIYKIIHITMISIYMLNRSLVFNMFILTLLFVSFPTMYDDKDPPNEDSVFAIPNIVPEI